MSDLQRQVQVAIDELVESGAERGVQVSVYRKGDVLVEAVAGVAEVTGPLGVADEVYFGMPASEHHRLARLEDAPSDFDLASMPSDLPMMKSAPIAIFPTAELGNRSDVLSADIPAGGKVSARGIARMYAALLDEVDGVRLVTPERLRAISAVSASGEDVVFGNPSTWALGYAIGRPGDDAEVTSTVFGMAGAGGSGAYADTATEVSFALTKNRLTDNFDAVNRISQIVATSSATR